MPEVSENPQARKSAWIPWVFFGGMMIVFAVNGLMAWFAVSTWSGLETKDYYRKGFAYNDVLKAAERQKALGWGVRLTVTPEAGSKAPGSFVVRADYSNITALPISGLRVRAHLIRPTHEGYDRKIELHSIAPGQYQGVFDIPLPGQWDVRLVAINDDGKTHQWLERIQVK